MAGDCVGCSRPVGSLGVQAVGGGIFHDRCYHLRVSTDWIRRDPATGEDRHLTPAEVAEHRAWAEETYPMPGEMITKSR